MKCPVCLQEMEIVELFEIQIDSCKFCGGVWLDGGELAGFIKKGAVPIKVMSSYALDDSKKIVKEGERNCPKCGDLLDVITFRGASVDACKKCNGIWFDRGEIKSIMMTYYRESNGETSGRPKPSPYIPTRRASDEEDMIRFDGEQAFEYTAPQAKPDLSAPTESGNMLENEFRSAGDAETIAKAIPKNALEKKKDPFLSGPDPFSRPVTGSVFTTTDLSLFDDGGCGQGGFIDAIIDFARTVLRI